MNQETKVKLLEMLNGNWINFLVGRYGIKVSPAGREHWVVSCPFHKENTASGHIRNANQAIPYPHYKCYGCGEFLNPIDFVMRMESVSFIEACKIIGGYVGMEITTAPKNPKHEEYKDNMCQHSRRYNRELQTNQEVAKYLKIERALTDATISQFMLGAVPDNEYQYRTDIGGIAGRISFPIFEHKLPSEAKVVGMGYRTLKDKLPDWDKSKDPKYKNDSTTKDELEGVFKKEDFLYGYQFAAQSIRKSQYAIVTEGYMDAISLHQSGVLNSVALMGTAFTESQMDILKQLTCNLILFLDSDSSGFDNMMKYVPVLLGKGFSVKIILSDAGKDPADMCKKLNFQFNDVITYVLKNSEPAVSTMINHCLSEYEKVVVRERTKALNALMPVVGLCNQTEQIIFNDLIYKRLDLK